MNLIVEIIVISLCIFGGLAIIAVAGFVIAFAIKYFMRLKVDLFKRYGREGWAVVTGGSQGLGLAFATEFAKAGIPVCLISSNQEHLNKAKAELITATKQESAKDEEKDKLFKTIRFDLNTDNADHLKELAEQVNNLPGGVSVLIHAARAIWLGKFEDQDAASIKKLIVTNAFSQALLTSLLFKNFKARVDANKKSAIITVGSVSGEVQLPGASVYSGAKGFNDMFSLSLAEEFWGKIDILSVKPSWVKTTETDALPDKIKNHWFWIKPEQVAQASIKNLGKTDETFGHWRHGCYIWYYKIMPRCCLRKCAFAKSLEIAEALKKPAGQA